MCFLVSFSVAVLILSKSSAMEDCIFSWFSALRFQSFRFLASQMHLSEIQAVNYLFQDISHKKHLFSFLGGILTANHQIYENFQNLSEDSLVVHPYCRIFGNLKQYIIPVLWGISNEALTIKS